MKVIKVIAVTLTSRPWVRGTIPVFWALTKATLLVSGLGRMKPHSLCIGLCVSGWKELNLDGKSEM